MQKFYVWNDNLLEDYFALEIEEFEKFPEFKNVLTKEKVQFNIVEADGIIEAIKLYKESLKKLYPIKEINEDDNKNEPILLNDIKKKRLLH